MTAESVHHIQTLPDISWDGDRLFDWADVAVPAARDAEGYAQRAREAVGYGLLLLRNVVDDIGPKLTALAKTHEVSVRTLYRWMEHAEQALPEGHPSRRKQLTRVNFEHGHPSPSVSDTSTPAPAGEGTTPAVKPESAEKGSPRPPKSTTARPAAEQLEFDIDGAHSTLMTPAARAEMEQQWSLTKVDGLLGVLKAVRTAIMRHNAIPTTVRDQTTDVCTHRKWRSLGGNGSLGYRCADCDSYLGLTRPSTGASVR